MTRLLLFGFFLIFTNSPSSFAGQLGLGVVIGNPIGISGNFYLQPRRSIDGVVAFNFYDNQYYIHSTYLHHHRHVLTIDRTGIDGYWGLGARLRQLTRHENFLFGPRLSGGLIYNVRSAPVDIFGELALVVDLIEKTGLSFNIGIGARYYF